jgi:hypothetical protein
MECDGVLARVMDKLQGHLKLASLVLLSSAGAVYALLTLVTTQVILKYTLSFLPHPKAIYYSI